MSKVITFSRQFPSYHVKAGEPTYFVEKIWEGIYTSIWNWDNFKMLRENGFSPGFYRPLKKHTVRAGYRFNAGDIFSPRVWGTDINPKSGRIGPYHSKQIIIAPDMAVKKVWDFCIDPLGGEYQSNGNQIPIDVLTQIALNDGFDNLDDFELWFNIKRGHGFRGQIICWDDNINYNF